MWVCLGDSSDRLFQEDDDTGYQKFWEEGYKKLPRAFTFVELQGSGYSIRGTVYGVQNRVLYTVA